MSVEVDVWVDVLPEGFDEVVLVFGGSPLEDAAEVDPFLLEVSVARSPARPVFAAVLLSEVEVPGDPAFSSGGFKACAIDGKFGE
jgi:hypothetical protein